jgi:predicted RNA-binding Zn-ribbon protein involved in translation (DUF1610 family)
MGIFIKNRVNKAEKVLTLWIGSVSGFLDDDLDKKDRDNVIFYFLGSIYCIAKNNRINDKEFLKLSTRLLIKNGYSQNDDINNIKIYYRNECQNDQKKFVKLGADHIVKWLKEKDTNAPILLSLSLEDENAKGGKTYNKKNDDQELNSLLRPSIYILEYICPNCGEETKTWLNKNIKDKTEYTLLLTEGLGGNMSKYYGLEVKCKKCNEIINIPEKVILIKTRIALKKKN